MRNPMSEYPGEWDGYDRGPICCVGECCGPGSYCCGHPDNIHEHTEDEEQSTARKVLFEDRPTCACLSSFDGEGDGRCPVHRQVEGP